MRVIYNIDSDQGTAIILRAETNFEKHLLTSLHNENSQLDLKVDYGMSKHISYDEVDEVRLTLKQPEE